MLHRAAISIVILTGSCLAAAADPPSTIAAKAAALPFHDELKALEGKWEKATPLAGTYPDDPSAFVSFELDGDTVITTALGTSVWKKDRAQLDKYVAAGADLNAAIWVKAGKHYPYRTFPVHIAINAADVSLFAYLLDHKADPNALQTVYAKLAGDTLDYSEETVLNHVVTSGKPELIATLLKSGVKDINLGVSTTKATVSPLQAAVVRRDAQAATLLLDHGADVNRGEVPVSGKAQSPLSLAEQMQKNRGTAPHDQIDAIVKLLRDHGAK